MSECKQCERAVRQAGEGAMCFNCYLEKTTPLPTAEEIENDDYSTYQVAKMAKRIAELGADLRTSINLREQTDMQLARTQNLLGKKVAELAELSADYHGERLRADSFFDQLATIKKKALAAVNAPYEDILDMGLAQALRELGEAAGK